MTYSDTLGAVPDWYWIDGADFENPDDLLTDWRPAVETVGMDTEQFFTDTYVTADHVNLESIREAAGMTPYELASRFGYQGGREIGSTVRQMERRRDFLVSRLAAYIHAAGGTAELLVSVNGQELRFDVC